MEFRGVPKRKIQALIPEELEDRVREAAFRNRRAPNEVVAELICRGFGIDPAKFGITPCVEPKRPSRPKVAV